MREYFDPKRSDLILVYADGTVISDCAAYAEVSNPLHTYLTQHWYSPHDTEVPKHIYAGCSFCGDLHECKVERDKEAQHISDDWIYVKYDVIAVVDEPHNVTDPVCTMSIRFDGRA